MRLLLILAVLILALAPTTYAAGKTSVKPVNPFIKSTEWSGKVVAIDEKTITVRNARGLNRPFYLYKGTVFGRNATGKWTDYKVGSMVNVSFSKVFGTNAEKAESIQTAKK
jgi:hypothetical protein